MIFINNDEFTFHVFARTAALNSMASNAKVVITAAGPFSQYGSLLVKCCATNGTHYCDITGETDWVREMIDKYRLGKEYIHPYTCFNI